MRRRGDSRRRRGRRRWRPRHNGEANGLYPRPGLRGRGSISRLRPALCHLRARRPRPQRALRGSRRTRQKGVGMTRAIRAPFFEIGPKTFLDRASLLEVAGAASAASLRYRVDVIITPPALDIEAAKRSAPILWVFAQAMDTARPGASTGAIT